MGSFTSYVAAGLLVVCATGRPDEVFLGDSHGAGVAIFARGGRDLLAGSSHHDVLNEGPGMDTVAATPGHDRCVSLERVIDGPC